MLGTQGDFPDAGKSPQVRQGLPPLDPAIAKFPPSLVLRCACTRAAFCHNKRPICHFKLAGKSVFYFSPSLTGVTLPAVNPWRGMGIPRTLDGLTHHNLEGAVWKGGASSSGEVRCRAPSTERKSVFSLPAFFFYQKESRTLTFGKVYCTLKR